jgi:hypothetical protein
MLMGLSTGKSAKKQQFVGVSSLLHITLHRLTRPRYTSLPEPLLPELASVIIEFESNAKVKFSSESIISSDMGVLGACPLTTSRRMDLRIGLGD